MNDYLFQHHNVWDTLFLMLEKYCIRVLQCGRLFQCGIGSGTVDVTVWQTIPLWHWNGVLLPWHTDSVADCFIIVWHRLCDSMAMLLCDRLTTCHRILQYILEIAWMQSVYELWWRDVILCFCPGHFHPWCDDARRVGRLRYIVWDVYPREGCLQEVQLALYLHWRGSSNQKWKIKGDLSIFLFCVSSLEFLHLLVSVLSSTAHIGFNIYRTSWTWYSRECVCSCVIFLWSHVITYLDYPSLSVVRDCAWIQVHQPFAANRDTTPKQPSWVVGLAQLFTAWCLQQCRCKFFSFSCKLKSMDKFVIYLWFGMSERIITF